MTDTAKNTTALFGEKSETRYEAFLEMALAAEQVWVLKDDEGCLIVTSGDEECLPVWPSEDAAAACAIADWKGLEPLAVSLVDWMEKWLPGMEKDDRVVAVFPNLAGESLVVAASELYAELDA
ncbi:DUF2750 domain-containing protein [Corallincola spongiicola]|uniref:DUF2750 domain-containing protein n=1 Tax=Corallincola spongiicola TaxID=2520508 RepID=A0ABY1WMK9_9GAMM|nr:DUF2750 domain-containing protein [Corallincola spongiicola]TAA43655.1 DUF2750 domain-containing protein [Corallincola spongiicola]